MPHSEYPSGSSCLCQGIKDYANAFLGATGFTMPPLQHVAPAGSSKVEPGTTPAQDVTLTYATVDALAAACGASRLDGGMHFTGAVQAAKSSARASAPRASSTLPTSSAASGRCSRSTTSYIPPPPLPLIDTYPHLSEP